MIVPVSRHLGKYEILHKLGRGGMADVYLAQDTAGGYQVALKLIEHSADADTRDSIEAERRGAFLQARLADIDPHVVRIYDAGDIEHFFFVAMEYVAGQDLSELMHGAALPPAAACDIALAVCQTLERAHTLQVSLAGKEYHGIVHGDIKPKNIRIEPRGDVRVLDFGIAKALSMSRRLTRNEFGSVPYASPERLETGDVNAQSDLWSLGVMLYEMAAGTQPFRAATTERLERIIRSHTAPPVPPDTLPESLRRILVKALAPDAAMRYATAEEFATDLAAFRGGRPVQANIELNGDMDATRRTFPPARDADDATRRTSKPAVASTSGVSISPKPKPSMFSTVKRVIAGSVIALLVWIAYVTTSYYFLWKRGRELGREVAAELITDPNQIWTRWSELAKGNSSSILLYGARHTVKNRLVSAADHVISTYRLNENQAIYEKDWEHARTLLAHVLQMDPGDDSVRGKLRLVEGHLVRINGTAKRNVTLLNQAVEKFNEAQQLLPKSPDPQLGLARVYVYGLRNIDKAYEALQLAERHGYKLGNRERGQLADGYRDRADRLWWDSRNVRGLPQERDQIKRAEDDYRRAQELYQSIVPYGNANANIVRVQQSLESVNFRLQQLDRGPQ